MDKWWDNFYDWKWWSTSSGWFLCDIQRGFGRVRELRPPRGSSRLSCVSFWSHLTWLIICKLTQGDNPACPALKQVQVTRILAPPRDADYEVPTKKQTKTLPHSQEAEAWPSDAQRFPTLGFPGCCKPQRSTGTCCRLPFSMVLLKMIWLVSNKNEKSKLTDLLDDILHELSVDWSSYDLKHREIRSVKHNKQSLQLCVNCAALRLWYDFLAILSGAKLWQSVAVGRLNMQDRRVRQIMSQHRPWGTWPI